MKEYFWKLAGGDPSILKISGKDSQDSFQTVGVLLVIINILVFFGFFGLFWGVFSTLFMALFGGSLLTFLIVNIYRLNLMSLEPPTLPIKSDGGSIITSYIVRISTVVLFAVFVSKCLETSLFGSYVDHLMNSNEINGNLITRYKYDTSEMFVEHMIQLNKTYPVVWLITILIAILFVYPIYLKHQLRNRHEYFSIKEKRDIRIVKEQYNLFEDELLRIYRKIHLEYKTFPIKEQRKFNEKGKFTRTDFYNLSKTKETNKKQSEDFIHLADWK